MVASITIDKQNLTTGSGETFGTTPERSNAPIITSKDAIPSIIQGSKEARFVRQLLTWRTPLLGFIKMYINPQQMTVSDKKISQTTRTKAGFVYQYAGEDLTRINIQGTTGSSGMEGINILHTIYRSEQAAFNGIASSIEQRLQTTQVLNFAQAASNVGNGASVLGQVIDQTSAIASAAITDIFNQPFPTLASLAANIELSLQGITYRGYFESFLVSENGNSPGLFDYTIEYTAYARQGTRRNFMPWHKQPYGPADSNGPNPLSYYTNYEFNAGPPNIPAPSPPQNGPASQANPTDETSTVTRAGLKPLVLPDNLNTNFNEFATSIKNLDVNVKRVTQIAAANGKSTIKSLIP